MGSDSELSSSEPIYGEIPDVSISIIVTSVQVPITVRAVSSAVTRGVGMPVTGNHTVYYRTSYMEKLTEHETDFSSLDSIFSDGTIKPLATCILVVQGYRDLCESWCLGPWMAEDEQLRSIVHQYLAPSGQRCRLPRTPLKCHKTTAAYWVRAVAQTRGKMDLEKKLQAANGRLYSPQNEDEPGAPPLGLHHTMYTRWPVDRLQPFQLLCDTEDEDVMCFGAEERVFFYDCSSADAHSKPKQVTGVVFLDPLRHFQVASMEAGNEGFVSAHSRLSRCFVAAPKDDPAACYSVKYDLAEIDTRTRFFEALQRSWGKGKAARQLDLVNNAVADMMHDDISHVTHQIGWALNDIEPHLFDNDMLRSSTKRWREELGRWRNVLARLNTELRDGPLQGAPELSGAREKVDRTARRVENVFKALVLSNTLARLEQEDEAGATGARSSGTGEELRIISGTWHGTVGKV